MHYPDKAIAYFLDSIIIFELGKGNSYQSVKIEVPVTNIILKKLRVAFKLKEDEMHAILKASKFPVSKHELSALCCTVRPHQRP